MMLITKVLKKTTGEDNEKTEMYGCSSTNLPSILIQKKVHDSKPYCPHRLNRICRDIGQFFSFSSPAVWTPTDKWLSQSWLWSTALLGSSFVGYDYGVAGPFWFAAGCSPMIVFFALLGISCKRKIPEAHTSLEVVRIRYGKLALVSCLGIC